MGKRYVRSKPLSEIGKHPNTDSTLWAEIPDNKPIIEKIIRCGENYNLEWIVEGLGITFKNTWNTLRNKEEIDHL